MRVSLSINKMTADQAANGNKKKKIAIISISGVILVAMVVAVTVGVTQYRKKSGSSGGSGDISASMKAVKAICEPTEYKETCVNKLSSAAGDTTDPKELIKIGFKVTMDELSNVIKNSSIFKELEKDPDAVRALESCKELVDYSLDDLRQSFEEMGEFDMNKLSQYVGNLETWLSGAITFQETCFDGFDDIKGNHGEFMRQTLKIAKELTSNALSMVTELSKALGAQEHQDASTPGSSRRLLSDLVHEEDGFPSWLNAKDRRVLAAGAGGFLTNYKPDLVVAKDGSGKYKTINAALKAFPQRSKSDNRTVIMYVKAGVYNEQVMIEKNMHHLIMIGDGPLKTKISGRLNFKEGVNTFKTATMAVVGANFIGKDFTVENTAGPEGHQAVALRVQADWSLFYNCHFNAYQDTLYVHAHRQYFRDCVISGTVDFIFGDAAVILQNCQLVVRKAMKGQSAAVTAQGRTDKNAVTGIVIQNCTIKADEQYVGLKEELSLKAFLGRPWKQYSRTVIMQSFIDENIQPEGWLKWDANNPSDFSYNTCYYAEFENRGPGSDPGSRVDWKGIKNINQQAALGFTGSKFYPGGDQWIRRSGVPYIPGMLNIPSA